MRALLLILAMMVLRFDGAQLRQAGAGPADALLPKVIIRDLQPKVEVTPTNGNVQARPHSQHKAVIFRVKNTGDTQAAFTQTCAATGAVQSCRVVRDSVQIAAGDWVRIPVLYVTGNNGSGTITLTSTTEGSSGTGTFNVTIIGAEGGPPGSNGTLPTGTGRGPSVSDPIFAIVRYNSDGMGSVTVDISPPYGTFNTASQDFFIEWCSWGSNFNDGSRNITFNGNNVTSSFTYYSTFNDCAATQTKFSDGTLTLNSGVNTLTASISNLGGQNGSSTSYDTLTLAAPAAPTVDASMNPNSRLVRSACVTSGAGPEGAFQCGDLLIAHSMPAFRTLDRDRSMTLLYNSATAKPYSIIMADVSWPWTVTMPDRIDATLFVTSGGQSTQRASYSFSSAGFYSNGSPRRIAVGFDPVAAGLATGVYPYTLNVTNVYASTSYTTSVTGDLIVVDRRASPYGAGWGVSGVERLALSQRNSALLLLDGDGSARVFESIAANTWLATAGAYRDTLNYGYVSGAVVPPNNYYWRRDIDGTTTYYHYSSGLQQYAVDRIGNEVEYTYSNVADPQSGLASLRIAPYGLAKYYTFGYTNGKLASITDPASRVLSASINGSSQLVSVLDPGFSTGKDNVFGYDASNRMTSWRSRRGYTTKYVYHDAVFGATGLLRSDTLPLSVVSSFVPVQIQGLASSTGTNASVSLDSAVVLVTGPRGGLAQFRVNADNAPVFAIDPMGIATQLSYDAANPLLPVRISYPQFVIVKRMAYDASARLMWAQDSTHSAGPSKVDYEYSNSAIREKPTKVIADRTAILRDTTSYVYDNTKGWLNSVTDPRGKTTSFKYTAAGQVDSITNPLSQLTQLTYGSDFSNLASVKTQLGNLTTYTYDAYGQVRTQNAPASGQVTVYRSAKGLTDSTSVNDATFGQLTTRFVYDDDANLTQRKDPRFIARNWNFDALGRDTLMTDEFGYSERKVFTADGLVDNVTHRDGSIIKSWYNAVGEDTLRVFTPVSGANYGGATDTIRTTYDGLGHPTVIENVNSRVTRTYTPQGSVATEEQYLKFPAAAGRTFNLQYTYNRGGARTGAVISDGANSRTVTYTRGLDNLLSGLSWSSKTASISYDDLGRRQTLSFPNTTSTSLTYDGDGRMSRATVGATVDHYFTSFDSLGRPLALTRVDFSGTNYYTWTYDKRGQITTSTGPTNYSFVYDQGGNRTRETTNSVNYAYSYVSGTDRIDKRCQADASWVCLINSSNTHQYRYNSNGDITRDSTSTLNIPFYRDANGRLTTLFQDSVQYRYDGLGRLVLRRDGFNRNLITGYDGVNATWHQGVFFLHGEGVDDPLVRSASASDCYFVTQGGRLLAYLTEGTGDCASGDWETNGKFAGAIDNSYTPGLKSATEGTSQLSFFRNRWYDAKIGRFTQQDPIGYAGGSNLYAYAGNNPAMYTDPFGLVCKDADGKTIPCDPGQELVNAVAKRVAPAEMVINRVAVGGLLAVGGAITVESGAEIYAGSALARATAKFGEGFIAGSHPSGQPRTPTTRTYTAAERIGYWSGYFAGWAVNNPERLAATLDAAHRWLQR